MITGLLRIETRHSITIWLAPVMAGLAWWVIVRPLLASPMAFWPDRSVQVLHLVAQIGPLLAAAGAWMAGRNHRRKMGDSITTTPYPSWLREIITCMAVVAWGLVAYLVLGSFILSTTAVRGAWGQPAIGPILVGLLAVPAQGTIGYAIGYRIPSRFTAPLVAVALFVAQNVLGAQGPLHWYQFFSPGVTYNTSIQFGTEPDLSRFQLLFVLGITGLAVGSLGITGPRTLAAGYLLVAAIVVTGTSMVVIHQEGQGGPFSNGITPLQFAQYLIPFRPVCVNERIPVCVHPAFKGALPTIAGTVNRVASPIVGFPGAPTRALDGDIVQVLPRDPKANGAGYWTRTTALFRKKGMAVFSAPPRQVITLSLDALPDLGSSFASQVAGSVISGTGTTQPFCDPTGCTRPESPAQDAIAIWLVQRAGFSVVWSELDQAGSPTSAPRVLAAARRFAAMPLKRQRAWLATHLASLRAGQVSLADLP